MESLARTRLALLFSVLLLFVTLTPARAYAGHLGGYLGTSLFFNSANNDAYLTWGLDGAMEVLPSFEVGAFFSRVSVGSGQTLVGGELNWYPLWTHDFYVGARVGNSNLYATNTLTYGPAAGVALDIAPTISLGIDGTYFLYANGSMSDLALLGSIKLWLF